MYASFEVDVAGATVQEGASMIRDTSIESYLKVPLGKRQGEMLRAFQAAPTRVWTDRQLAKFLRWPINTVVPRRNELAAKGLIVEAGWIFDSETKRRVTLWQIGKRC